jgi:hypothetical protein
MEKRGVGAMELVAIEMKSRDMYVARQLSFKDVTFGVEEVLLSPEQIDIYDKSVEIWVQLLQSLTEAAELVNADPKTRSIIHSQYWSTLQRFFYYLCISAKTKRAVKLAQDAVKCGKCVVIGLQSTGEASTLDQMQKEGKLLDFVSPAKAVLQSLVETYFPAPDPKKCHISEDNAKNAATIKENLLAQIKLLGSRLPPNFLDQLIDELGGPDIVAEMTGRKGRLVHNEIGQVSNVCYTCVRIVLVFFIFLLLFFFQVQYESREEIGVLLENVTK